MGAFRHHSYFAKPKHVQAFRFPFVCFTCRKAMKYPASHMERRCVQCRGPMIMLSRKFSAPKSKDLAQWAKVKFLVDHGFRFYSVYEPAECGGMVRVAYPKTLREAEEFVVRYRAEAKRQMPKHSFNRDALTRVG